SNPTLSATILYRSYRPYRTYSGEVQEWLNWQHWKCCERETVPWVRIPPSPPDKKDEGRMKDLSLVTGSLRRSGSALILNTFAFILVFSAMSLLAPIAGQSQVKNRRATR